MALDMWFIYECMCLCVKLIWTIWPTAIHTSASKPYVLCTLFGAITKHFFYYATLSPIRCTHIVSRLKSMQKSTRAHFWMPLYWCAESVQLEIACLTWLFSTNSGFSFANNSSHFGHPFFLLVHFKAFCTSTFIHLTLNYTIANYTINICRDKFMCIYMDFHIK